MTAKKATPSRADQLTALTLLTPLDEGKKVKEVKKVTWSALDEMTVLDLAGPEPLPARDLLDLTGELGWTVRHLAHLFGIPRSAAAVLEQDGNLEDVVLDRYRQDPATLRDLLTRVAARAGGWDTAVRLAAWRPPARRAREPDNDPEEKWETPWDAGAPPLVSARERRRALGWVPTRRQILAGYRDPQDGVVVEGQISRAQRELGAAATIDQIARRLATHPGDRDFLEVMFTQLGAKMEEVNE